MYQFVDYLSLHVLSAQ